MESKGEQGYKYRFKELIEALPQRWQRIQAKELLMEAWDIKTTRYYDILSAGKDSTISITAEQLIAASKILNIEPAAILGEEIVNKI